MVGFVRIVNVEESIVESACEEIRHPNRSGTSIDVRENYNQFQYTEECKVGMNLLGSPLPFKTPVFFFA